MSNKDKVAIVVVGYNRLHSIKRLLSSLLKAKYSVPDVPLCISIDASGCTELYDYVQRFKWPFGEKIINIQEQRLGLRNHILKCGDYTEIYKAIILLEDDIYVSEYFYDYVLKAIDFYYDEERIAGISLYRNEVANPYLFPVVLMQDGSDFILRQTVASWGECWTDKQWSGFKKWYNELSDESLKNIDMPEDIKRWEKAWSKFFMAYEVETDKYFLFPSVSHTTCFSDSGENNSMSTCIGQANLLCGPKVYNSLPFDKMVKYDIYTTNLDIYKWLGYSKEEVCVNFYGLNHNLHKKRFLLTTFKLPFKVVKSFGLVMRPIELNIRENIPGNEIFLYDTEGRNYKLSKYPPITLSYYYLRYYNQSILVLYLLDYYLHSLKIKIRNLLRIK